MGAMPWEIMISSKLLIETLIILFIFNYLESATKSPLKSPKFAKRNRNQTTDGMLDVNSNVKVL